MAVHDIGNFSDLLNTVERTRGNIIFSVKIRSKPEFSYKGCFVA